MLKSSIPLPELETVAPPSRARLRMGWLAEVLDESVRLLEHGPAEMLLLPENDDCVPAAHWQALQAAIVQASAPSAPHLPAQAGGADTLPTPGEVTQEDISAAVRLLHTILSSPNPASMVAERLDEIIALLPALLEINIRKATADGRPDLAAALRNLAAGAPLDIAPARVSARHSAGAKQAASRPAAPGSAAQPARRVLFLMSSPVDNPALAALPAGALSEAGVEVSISTQFPDDFQHKFDVVVARYPHASPDAVKKLAACAAADIPIILDFDLDIEQMPINHPFYSALGLATEARSRAYSTCLALAACVRTPNQALANAFRAHNREATVIPNAWNTANPLWHKPVPEHGAINLGWIQRPSELEDLASIRRIILRVLREFPQARLVIVGEPQAYQMFDGLPESRRMYLPPVDGDDQPYIYHHMDVLLAPLRATPFNASLSDDRLVEAGVCSLPWVGSPTPAFMDWGQGGLLAASLDEWHTHLRQLLLDENSRAALGLMGRMKAEEREITRVGRRWLDLVQNPQ